MRLQLTDEARELLADVGFDPVLGARPLRRAIQRDIEDVLSEQILYGQIGAGEIVGVGVEGEGDDAKFTFQGTKKEPEPATVPAHAAGSDLEGPDHIAGLGGGGHASGAAPEGGAAAES